MHELFIGILSGTSMDAIDAALVDFSNHPLQLLATHSNPLPIEVKQSLLAICHPGLDEINRAGQLDSQLGVLFAETCQQLIAKASVNAKQIYAIGSHGQSIRHQPNFKYPFTLQIGDPNIITAQTGITTVADFRRRDLAVGGQGAPLTPAFHNYVLHNKTKNRAIVNIGGIVNITFLPADNNLQVTGYDSGPGNTLIDAWIRKQQQLAFDDKGNWAASGKINSKLLDKLLSDPYFQQAPPKSTGPEYFNLNWLTTKITETIASEDVQATLTELTVITILHAINHCDYKIDEVLICGGGIRNEYLLKRLRINAPQYQIDSTQKYGINPAWVEAMAFAWLAKQTLDRKPGNLPSVTGAKYPTVLGAIFPANII